jgi:phosphotransferase system HPr (HPr) family protein
MREFKIKVPQGVKISNLGFATALVEKAYSYTSDDVNIKINNSQYVNAKSILGLLTLNYNTSEEIEVQIIGESEDYSATNFERFIKKLVALYNEGI